MKKRFLSVFFGVVFLSCSFGSAVFAQTNPALSVETTSTSSAVSVAYSEQELSSLLKPSIVRIVQSVKGSATIPSFIIKDGMIAVDKNKKPATIPVENINILGSGFFVSEDGYILTNAHFVSETSSKLMVINSFVKKSIEEEKLVDKKTGKVSYRTPAQVTAVMNEMFTDQTVDFILKSTTFKIVKEIVVIDPKKNQPVPKDTVFDLSTIGLSAVVAYVNDEFYKQGDDIALLKVSGSGFPSVDLSRKETLSVSDTVFVFKLPVFGVVDTMNELSVDGISVAEIVKAIVVRTETAASSTSMVYKTDLIGGDDSSGGMVFTDDGKVVGIVSYDGIKYILDKDTQYQSIIPTSVLRGVLQKRSITEKASAFGDSVRNGFAAVEKMWCESAQKHFLIATSLGSSFVPANYFDSYVKKCNEVSQTAVAASQKKETSSFSITEKLTELFNTKWFSIAILVFLVVVLILLFVLIIRKFSRKKTTEERSAAVGSERSEEVSRARRMPLSEKIPLTENEEVPQGRIDHSGKNVMTVPKKSDMVSNDVSTFVSATAAAPSELSAELENIPVDDQKLLSSLWPTKYGGKGSAAPVVKTTPVEKPVSTGPQTATEMIRPTTTSSVETTVSESFDYTSIIAYIKQTRALGFSDDLIKRELLITGWPEKNVMIAFGMVK